MPIPHGVRPVLLVIAVILGNSLHNVNCSPKSSWMIGFVADDRRGKFTAYLQIISLVGGIIFSYVLGAVIDAYEARGYMRGAFIVSGIIVAAMSLIHVILFISTKEIPNDSFVEVSVMSQIKSIISNKNLMKIMPIYFIYYISAMCATPFYSTYQIKELGFSMSFIAILSAISAAVRSLASIFCGRYGDKRGFMRLLNICYILMAVAFFINIFTTPSNGKVFYTIYLVIHSVALAGTGIADTNLIYEYAPLDTRVGVMAIKGTVCGAISFVVTLLMSGLVSYIQESGNSFLGMNLYAQQVVSAIAFIGIVLLIVYINTVAKTAKNRHEA